MLKIIIFKKQGLKVEGFNRIQNLIHKFYYNKIFFLKKKFQLFKI